MKSTRSVQIGPHTVGGGNGLLLIAGPCVIESREGCLAIARALAEFRDTHGVPLVFKASYDKANRTSVDSFRGPGMDEGLAILREVKATFGFPILTDIHAPEQAAPVSEVADVLQIPAFLCRQTDLLLAAAATGAVVNVKKAQFLSAGDMRSVVKKLESTGNRKILLTERGTCFGYNTLVVDMRNLVWMRDLGYPVIFDATHSVQRPGAGEGFTAGDGVLAPDLARAAVAVGVDGLFLETHLTPSEARSDRENLMPLPQVRTLWKQACAIREILT